MSKIIDFIKEKSYYLLGATVLIIVFLIIISSCSSTSSYDSIENDMVNAAEKYYYNHEKKLPKEEGSSVQITINTLIDAELLKEVKDPNNSENSCNGYVEVTKVGKEYSYVPFLTCKGSYEPKYLVDKIKDAKTDEYGNGVYTINNELVYRGKDVKNYVKFNNMLWRIIKVDESNDIKIVSIEDMGEVYAYDDTYNSEVDDTSGNTSDYVKTSIRKNLNSFYKKVFDADAKAKIVAKTLCVGKYEYIDMGSDKFSVEKECAITKEKEKIGLITATDYQNASLDSKCIYLESKECSNYNYMANDEQFYTWTLNSYSNNTYRAIYLGRSLGGSYASSERKLNPVIYLTNKVITVSGNGTKKNPYVIK